MHPRDFLTQPVNFVLSAILITLFGLVMASAILQEAGLPDPVTGFGEVIARMILGVWL